MRHSRDGHLLTELHEGVLALDYVHGLRHGRHGERPARTEGVLLLDRA